MGHIRLETPETGLSSLALDIRAVHARKHLVNLPSSRRTSSLNRTGIVPISKAKVRTAVTVFLLCFAQLVHRCEAQEAASNANDSLKSLTLEQLGRIEVTAVSKEPAQVWRTPAAIYVITHEDILRSGATSIPEILRGAPGVQVGRIDSSSWAVGAAPRATRAGGRPRTRISR